MSAVGERAQPAPVTAPPQPTPEALDTPCLTVDLDRVERNVSRMQAYCDRHGIALRPHIKTHKLPALAHLQLRTGARGIACQKLGEAEVMVAAGVEDVLVTFPLLGERKLERLVRLARQARIAVVGDSAEAARPLAAALERAGLELPYLVDCDTGFGRTGVQSVEEALALGRLVDGLAGLRLAGLMTYPTTPAAGPWLAEACDAFARAGLDAGWVSSGGTPNAFATHEAPAITEMRPGTYVYGDRSCVADGSVPADSCALFVRATVVSRPTPDRAILDAGSKALSSDPTVAAEEPGFGHVVEYPEAVIRKLSEEHGHVDLGGCERRPRLGEVVSILPNHACAASNLHERVVAHRCGEVVGVWPVAARGRLA